jgi:hypothetical protein
MRTRRPSNAKKAQATAETGANAKESRARTLVLLADLEIAMLMLTAPWEAPTRVG